MANTIQIKRSAAAGTSDPTNLEAGELAWLNNGSDPGELWIGSSDSTPVMTKVATAGAGSTAADDITTGDANITIAGGSTHTVTTNATAAANTVKTTTSGKVHLNSAGQVDIDAAADLDIDCTTGFTLDATTLSIDGTDDSNLTVTGSAKDLDIAVAGGSTQELRLASAGTGASALHLNASAGSVDIDAAENVTVDAADEIHIATTSADGHMTLTSAHTSGLAFHIDANANAGSEVQIDAGILDIDVTAGITMDGTTVSIDGTDTSNLTMTTNSGSDKTMTIKASNAGSGDGIIALEADSITIDNLAAASVPTLNQNTTGTAANVSGTPALPDGTTATTQSAGTNNTTLATTAYVDAASDAAALGLVVKTDCAVATTTNITLSGEQSIDGVTTSTSRILVKDQTDASQNGIYTTASGSWSRVSDFDAAGDQIANAFVFVTAGTAGADTSYVCTNDTDSQTVGTDDINWAQFNAAGNLTAGTGLSKSTNTLSVAAAQTGITSVKHNSLIIGGNSQNNTIDFGTDDVILFDTDSTERMRVDAAGVDITGALTVSGSYGLASGDIPNNAADTSGNADTATLATSITATANNSTDETVYLTFVDGATGTQGIETDTGLSYNPNSGMLTSAGVTTTVTGTATGLAGTPNITVGTVAAGAITTTGKLTLDVAATTFTPATDGILLHNEGGVTYTDNSTSASGTATQAYLYSFEKPTFAASNSSVTTTTAATVFISGDPVAGSNQTLTNSYALYVDGKIGGATIDGGSF
tara:strand:- start:241 stop:2526 length:2286 start_codon:yes stop_codon:yes gene_type:complete